MPGAESGAPSGAPSSVAAAAATDNGAQDGQHWLLGGAEKIHDPRRQASKPWSPGSKATKAQCAELGLLLHLGLTSMSGREIAAEVFKKSRSLCRPSTIHAAGPTTPRCSRPLVPTTSSFGRGCFRSCSLKAAAPAIAYDTCFDEWLYTKDKMTEPTTSRRKGLFRVAMVRCRDCKHLEGKQCTWPDAYNAAQATFASRGLTAIKVDIELGGARIAGPRTPPRNLRRQSLGWFEDLHFASSLLSIAFPHQGRQGRWPARLD